MATIRDLEGMVRLTQMSASAATVGRPNSIHGKNVFPRRSKVTEKEVDYLKSKAYSNFPDGIKKPIKAGGPGSGRHPEGGSDKQQMHNRLTKLGFVQQKRDPDSYSKGKHLIQINRDGRQGNWWHGKNGFQKGSGSTFAGLHKQLDRHFGQ